MSDNYSLFEARKQDHIELAMMPSNQSMEHNGFDNLVLRHEALPNLNLDQIQLSSQRFGRPVAKPFMVSSMTAGHEQAEAINRRLMAGCAQSGWAMGVGSQRRELTDPKASGLWEALTRDYPKVSLFSNLGIAQIITTPPKDLQRLTEALKADALIVHCNALQECIQPEGTPQFQGCWQALERLVRSLPVPIVVKETGCGFSAKTLRRLNELGVAAVDVSGLGGTHWGRIEGHRAEGDSLRLKAATTFRDWGITTVQSLLEARSLAPHYEIWGSGGIRHGLDAAKVFAMGASTVGFAKPLLEAALGSEEQVHQLMSSIEYELTVAMFCTGSQTLTDLKDALCL